MIPLLLLGGGGHCRACIDVIEAGGRFSIAGIVHAESSPGGVLGYPVVGKDEDLPSLIARVPTALVAVGQIRSANVRKRLFQSLKLLQAEMPVIHSPNSFVSRRAALGVGSIVMHGAILNSNVVVGENCIVNTAAILEHDVFVGDHCHISTGARVNGGVYVGHETFIGSGAVIREGVRIGDRVVIGAGQVVLNDIEPGVIVRGGRG